MVKNYFLTYCPNYLKGTQNFMCILLFILSLGFSHNIYTQTGKTSTTSGNWTSVNWNPTGTPSPNDNAVINTQVTIPLGTTVEINDLRIASNGILIIKGNLKVHGNISMDNKTPEFIMGDEAVVTVTGNFNASNKIDISISSYLIIQGDFKKSGSSGQGSLDVSNGNIYIFGEVDGFPELTSCDGTYDGTTTEETEEPCDYGTEEDYVNNQESFPPEVQALINCFALTKLDDLTVCSTSDVTFIIDPITEVTYQWQKKLSSGGWTDIIGEEGNSLTISNTTVSLSGNKYRVVVNATSTNPNNCKIGISNFVILTVIDSTIIVEPISGISQVCPSTSGINYTIPLVNNATSYNWTIPSDWVIEAGQNTSSITVTSGISSGTNTIMVSVTNSCGTLASEETSVDIQGMVWTGNISTDWNIPGNWNCNLIPVNSSDVLIPNGLSNYPILNSGGIGQSNSLIIESNATLEVLNNTLEIYGLVSNSGSFNVLGGTISYKGSAAQLISLNIFMNNRIENLTIDNFAGVSVSGLLEITGILKVQNGSLLTGDNLTLISTSTKTALIDGSGGGSISGNITMQRHLDPAMGYKYFSSPFQNTVVGDYANVLDLTATFPNFYRYNENRENSLNEDATGFETYSSSSSPLSTLEGYALNFGSVSAPKTVEIAGTVTNGSQQIDLSHNNGTYTKGFNLVGNPYPSPIDWNATSGWTKTNIDDAIYYFTASDQYTGTYSSYVNGIQSGGGSSANIIPSMQGFFVHVTDSPSGAYPVFATLGTTNAVRVTDFSQQFYKSPKEDSFTLIRLNAAYDAGILKDEAVVYFNSYATESFDKDYDALKLMNTDPTIPNLYSISNASENLSINAVSSINGFEELIIPLGLNIENEGWITISLKNKEEMASSSYIYLVDLEKKISVNLINKTEYRFFATSGKNEKRFQLLFSDIQINDPAIIFNDLFSVIQRNGSVKIKMNLDIGKVGDIKVTTVTGQILDTQFVASNDLVEINGIKSPGLYFISFYSHEGIFTKKVLIQK